MAREERRLQAEARKESKESKRPPREKRERRPQPPGEKRIRKLKIKVPSIEFKLPPRPSKPVFPCILCPDRSSTQLMPVHRLEPVMPVVVPTPPILSAPVGSAENSEITTEGTDLSKPVLVATNSVVVAPEPIREKAKKPEFAHLACVRSTPELWIADVWDHVREKSVRKVMGIETIGRERWNLVSDSNPVESMRGRADAGSSASFSLLRNAQPARMTLSDTSTEPKSNVQRGNASRHTTSRARSRIQM